LNQEFYSSGLAIGKHPVVVEHRSPHINQQLFPDDISRVLLPFLRKVHTNPLLFSRLAVLLMDKCKAHMGDEGQKVLADYGVMMITRAPRATNIFQVLDISLFGIFKLIKGNTDESGMVHEMSNHVVKTIRAIQRWCNPPNIQAAFQKAGFESISVSEPALITFHEERLRQMEGFREIWDTDFPIEDCSRRRQESSYGFVNSRFLSKPLSTE
jgi:hypothetical protein